ncbi:multicopper oxidase family protein [Acidisphaera rubrifaciens]|uniref:Multicopper oxidase n=1 Tax=Acidisphaera rubrifaciens HS-AP3 TaxID=1231350 RepID=A0A0D6P667_9PROT|nr:multicopper oxidase family protein [Acidisphaera rubrifaciens]GAN76374.1 multicopper oxidase [Acidisphaera rubrifaciens HS-AP3]
MQRITRRRALVGGFAVAALAASPRGVRATDEAAQAPLAGHGGQTLVASTRSIDVDGRPATVFRLLGPDDAPGLRLAPGERFRVGLRNATTQPTIIHWHGQLPPWTQDGFPWPQTPPIPAGGRQDYDYAPIPGTFWMHSHHGLQEQALMTAPLIVRTAEELREDRQEVVLMLHDFSHRPPEALLAGVTGRSAAQTTAMMRAMDSAPPIMPAARMRSAVPRDTAMGGMAMKGMSAQGGLHMAMEGDMAMDLNDIDYDAFLANDRTLGDPEVVRTAARGRLRLRIINASSSTQFWIDLGRLTGEVVAADGHAVRPVSARRLPLAIAQRLDVLIDLPGDGAYPILAEVEGRRDRTGIVVATPGAPIARIAAQSAAAAPAVDNSLEAILSARTPLVARSADVTRTLVLSGGMRPYVWTIDGATWPAVTPFMVRRGQRIEIDMVNRSMMAHPMHLHGHAFQVIALDRRPVAGAVRDTVLVPPMGRVRIAFDADNPGRWALHCHNLYHMAAGMMTEVRYDGIA